jgi:NRPS condensation-like uncharacterized protein
MGGTSDVVKTASPLKRSEPKIVRRVSNYERMTLRIPGGNVALYARITGNLAEDELMRALKKVRTMHPLVGAKVVFDGEKDAWFSTDDVPGPLLRVVPRQSDFQWLNEIAYEHTVPFDPSTGPLIRFVLLSSPQASDLIAFAQHAICDGKALAILMRDILVHVANPHLETKVISPPTLADCIPKTPYGAVVEFIIRPFISLLNRQWSKKRWVFDHEDFLNIHAAFWQKRTYEIVLLELKKDETKRLTARCREHEITVGSAVTTAFLAAYSDICGPFNGRHKNVGVPYDLRTRLDKPVGDVFCLLGSGFEVKFAYDPHKSFWQNAQAFHRKVRRKLDSRDRFGTILEVGNFALERFDPTLVEVFASFAVYANEVPEGFSRYDKLSAFVRDKDNIAFKFSKWITSTYTAEPTSSNLGRLNFPEKYGALRLERMFFAPVAGPSPLLLGGVGVSGTATFTWDRVEDVSGNGGLDAATALKVRDRALEYLEFPEKKATKHLYEL